MDDEAVKIIKLCKEVDELISEKTDSSTEVMTTLSSVVSAAITSLPNKTLEQKLEHCNLFNSSIRKGVIMFHEYGEDVSEQPTDIETTNPPNTNSPWAK